MPQGRHRQAPPLNRLFAPAGVVASALLCAGGGLFVDDIAVLRALTVGAAVAAVSGAVLLRFWSRQAGRRVAEVRAAKANAALLAEERAAELEADARESRMLRAKLEKRLRAERGQLAKLRTEHAMLLRRYATAETARASALEGRRQLAIAAAEPVRELTTGAADHRTAAGAPSPLTYLQAHQALVNLRRSFVRQHDAHAAQLDSGRASAGQASRSEEQRSEGGFSFFGAPPRSPAQGGQLTAPASVTQPPYAPPPPAPAAPYAPQAAPPPMTVPTERSRPATRDRRQVVGKVIDLAD